MAEPSPLIVPITVEAFVANATVRANSQLGAGYLRTQMDYGNMVVWGDGSATVEGNDINFTVSGDTSTYDGVYLKWRLPDVFTQGESNSDGTTTFPLVPNRWLVVRFNGVVEDNNVPTESIAAWIVESDAANTGQPPPYSATGANFLSSPPSGTLPVTSVIGTNTPMTGQAWANSGTPFLYAIGPGNPAFATYQPFCNNVFSFMDALGNETPEPPSATLAYAVIGWYSDLSSDPLANVTTAAELDSALANLNWSITPTGVLPNCTLCSGFITNVGWNISGTIPSNMPASPPLVAVASSSIEALTSLVASQDGDLQPQLLEALQLGQLRLFDQADGMVLLQNAVLANGFQKFPGGSEWQMTHEPKEFDPLAVAALALLNDAQAKLDEANVLLATLQSALYDAWWNDSQGAQSLPPQLDPSIASPPSLAFQVLAQTVTVDLRRIEVNKLAEAMKAFKGVKIRRVPSSFYAPKDPVLLIAGGGASGIVGTGPVVLPPLPLPCRFPTQLLTSITCDGDTIVPSTPTPPASTLPVVTPADSQAPSLLGGVTGTPWSLALVTALLDECFFLDPNNAQLVANATGLSESDVAAAMANPQAAGSTILPPPNAMAAWQANPWHPILLFWTGHYMPIPYGTTSDPSWTFEGTSYSWTNDGLDSSQSIEMSGTIVLTPAAAMNLQLQLQQIIDSGSDPEEQQALQALQTYITTNDQWDFVSQALDGFNEQLLMRMSGVFFSPSTFPWNTSPPLASLIGPAGGYPPQPPNAPDNFQPWRGGQFNFSEIDLVDEWGQTLYLLLSGGNFNSTIVTPSEWTPPEGTQPATIQLPPTLLQPAQLDFDLVSAIDDNDSSPTADPVCGWALSNLLDQSLMIYDAEGHMLGELSAGAGTSQSLCWSPAPGSLAIAPGLILNPHLRGFVEMLAAQSTSTFAAVLQAIDTATSNTIPVGSTFDANLALLIGTPLALVRASVQLGLYGAPYADPQTQQSLVTSYVFGVQLGNVEQSGDGLIGYFLGDDYCTFNVIQASGAAVGEYLQPIGVNGNYIDLTVTGPAAFVSMLIDPRLPVNAYSAILPVSTVSVPAALVQDALARMDVTFRVNTVLTQSRDTSTLFMPVPVAKGKWSWLEQHGLLWEEQEVVPSDPNARLSSAAPTLRRGLLRLKTKLD